jgi:hypothetical protein
MIDHDSGTFTLWRRNPSTKSDLIPVRHEQSDAGASETCDSGAGKDGGVGKKSNAGAIAGGVVGGVALLAIPVAIVFFLRKKQKKQAVSAGYSPVPMSTLRNEGESG